MRLIPELAAVLLAGSLGLTACAQAAPGGGGAPGTRPATSQSTSAPAVPATRAPATTKARASTTTGARAATTTAARASTTTTARDSTTTAATAAARPAARATTSGGGSSGTSLAAGRPGAGTYPPGPCRYRSSAGASPYGAQALPDPACTPGAVDPAVTQADLDRTVCREGWTDTVRPPESYTEPLKFAALATYGQPGVAHLYELDHLVPLELGGAPSDPRNLWPEPDDHPEGPSGYYANSKDWVEHELNRAVCDRRVPLAAAQEAVAGDWETALGRLGLPSVPPWER
ncbi:MAG: hypothetical protein ACRD0L_15720 [Acidimicrobiales bacterium]